MATQKRQSGTPLKKRLFEEFYNFSFFKSVELLESIYPEKKHLGETLKPCEEAVRFTVTPSLCFPASDISGLEPGDEESPAKMDVTFLGLLGPNGVLPNIYNEMAIQRNKEKDYTLTAFLDIFHHRLISLFYLAWKKHRFPENYLAGAKDKLSNYLLSLTGLGTAGLAGRIGIPEESLSFFSGFLSNPVSSVAAIESAVEYYSGTKAKVEQFIDRMLPLEPEDQTQLGVCNIELGVDTLCGDHVWENQTKFRINVGPMDYKNYLRFMPSGDLFNPTISFIRYMVGIEYEFEIRMFMKREEINSCIIGGDEKPTSPRLGWSTWLLSPGVVLDSDPFVTFQEN